jgi:hypothetical protein
MNAMLETRAFYENEAREQALDKRFELFLDSERLIDVIELDLAETEDADIRESYVQLQAALVRVANALDAIASGVPAHLLSASNLTMFRRLVHLSRCARTQFQASIDQEFQQLEGGVNE